MEEFNGIKYIKYYHGGCSGCTRQQDTGSVEVCKNCYYGIKGWKDGRKSVAESFNNSTV